VAKRDLREPIQTRPETMIINDDLGELQRRTVPKHRQCPRCFAGVQNGVGQCNGTYAKASSLTRRYYRCDRCAHTWVVDLKPEQVRDLDDEGLTAKAAAGPERREL
jgi:hypothetical protein